MTKLQLDHKLNGYDAQMGSIQGDYPYEDGTTPINAQRYVGNTRSNSADLKNFAGTMGGLYLQQGLY